MGIGRTNVGGGKKKTELLLIPTNYTGGDNPTLTYTKTTGNGTISSSVPTISPVKFYNFSATNANGDTYGEIAFAFPRKAKKIKLYGSGNATGANSGDIWFYSNGVEVESWGQSAQPWSKGYTLVEVDVSNIQDPSLYLKIKLRSFVNATTNFTIYGLEYEY